MSVVLVLEEASHAEGNCAWEESVVPITVALWVEVDGAAS